MVDETGNIYGRLTVLERAGTGKWGHILWLCECECGSQTEVYAHSLRAGDSQSCGCLAAELTSERNTKYDEYHGQKVCSVKGCDRSVHCRGLCVCHYQRACSYGLTTEEVVEAFSDVPDACEICHQKPDDDHELCYDHNHSTGQHRGWLCKPCNVGLGSFKDDPKRLEQAVEYLRSH